MSSALTRTRGVEAIGFSPSSAAMPTGAEWGCASCSAGACSTGEREGSGSKATEPDMLAPIHDEVLGARTADRHIHHTRAQSASAAATASCSAHGQVPENQSEMTEQANCGLLIELRIIKFRLLES